MYAAINTAISCVNSVQQKSSGLKFRTSRSGSDMPYSFHHH